MGPLPTWNIVPPKVTPKEAEPDDPTRARSRLIVVRPL